ncbi:hypothetical protein PoB_006191100 [Plakobranchus ocellatus]|uniref:Uncharacterized protein n=1 Tax=Plakobranchus ocellatus TaxID=259542 RepID=A0AAV4CU63_9GAST|nr:hypothetical protein PoB_006191100 [Plakobranchus ocellatus]
MWKVHFLYFTEQKIYWWERGGNSKEEVMSSAGVMGCPMTPRIDPQPSVSIAGDQTAGITARQYLDLGDTYCCFHLNILPQNRPTGQYSPPLTAGL